jgi:hypothetical protein
MIQNDHMSAITFWLRHNHNNYRKDPIPPAEPISDMFRPEPKSVEEIYSERGLELIEDQAALKYEAAMLLSGEERAETLAYEDSRIIELVRLMNEGLKKAGYDMDLPDLPDLTKPPEKG